MPSAAEIECLTTRRTRQGAPFPYFFAVRNGVVACRRRRGIMFVIPLNVAVSNAIIFFLVDVPAVWAIQRGLLALQAYYLCIMARTGRTVPLARSRIPIVGGELLRGVTRWPSVFVLINLAVLVCLCFATLGVDAGEEPKWESASYRNITSLTMPSSRELKTSIFPDTASAYWRRSDLPEVSLPLYFRDSGRENRTCRTRNATHADYWPVVFNATRGGRGFRSNAWFADYASCQANASESNPMFTASCVPIVANTTCSLDTMSTVLQLRLRNDFIDGRENLLDVDEYGAVASMKWTGSFEMSSSNPSKDAIVEQLVGLRVIEFRYHFNGTRESISSLLINDSSTDSWFLAFGTLNSDTDDHKVYEISISQPLRLSPHGSASVEYILFALRTNIGVAEFMQGIRFSSNQHIQQSTFELFESILQLVYRGLQLPTSQVAYVQQPYEDVTTIDLRAAVLYSSIIALAIILFPMKELLAFVLVRHGNLKEADLLVYEYDLQSKKIRALTERLVSAPLSGEFSSLQLSGR